MTLVRSANALVAAVADHEPASSRVRPVALFAPQVFKDLRRERLL